MRKLEENVLPVYRSREISLFILAENSRFWQPIRNHYGSGANARPQRFRGQRLMYTTSDTVVEHRHR